MSTFDLERIKQGIFCCMSDGTSCKDCPYYIYTKLNESIVWCEDKLRNDVNEIFMRFEILNDNEE